MASASTAVAAAGGGASGAPSQQIEIAGQEPLHALAVASEAQNSATHVADGSGRGLADAPAQVRAAARLALSRRELVDAISAALAAASAVPPPPELEIMSRDVLADAARLRTELSEG